MKTDIISLNKDVESLVIQASKSRSQAVFKDEIIPLTFAHFADVHNVLSAWNRIVEYVNYYSNYISFALHTGDYCGGSQKLYTDFYNSGIKCNKPIYNCVGNHDCYSGEGEWVLNKKEVAYNLLFNNIKNWNVNFLNVPYSMSYYKDFPSSNLRLIVLDDYYHINETRVWLENLLNDANKKGIHVITAQHESTNFITKPLPCNFNTIDDYVNLWIEGEKNRTPVYDSMGRPLYEDIIVNFINNGGKFVCNLAGHDHIDEFGYTDKGVLNVVVANATTWDAISDIKRVENTKSQDLFNVFTVDTNLGVIKIVRVGANVDHCLRKRVAICYDYINKKIISEVK